MLIPQPIYFEVTKLHSFSRLFLGAHFSISGNYNNKLSSWEWSWTYVHARNPLHWTGPCAGKAKWYRQDVFPNMSKVSIQEQYHASLRDQNCQNRVSGNCIKIECVPIPKFSVWCYQKKSTELRIEQDLPGYLWLHREKYCIKHGSQASMDKIACNA